MAALHSVFGILSPTTLTLWVKRSLFKTLRPLFKGAAKRRWEECEPIGSSVDLVELWRKLGKEPRYHSILEHSSPTIQKNSFRNRQWFAITPCVQRFLLSPVALFGRESMYETTTLHRGNEAHRLPRPDSILCFFLCSSWIISSRAVSFLWPVEFDGASEFVVVDAAGLLREDDEARELNFLGSNFLNPLPNPGFPNVVGLTCIWSLMGSSVESRMSSFVSIFSDVSPSTSLEFDEAAAASFALAIICWSSSSSRSASDFSIRSFFARASCLARSVGDVSILSCPRFDDLNRWWN